ncbi:hypothetical protein [Nocardia sp. NPDC056100]|uniref:hypothetical protein n=1 Tax=Nocardia sp. NPDC056100 TaxID=3345712 RepID=UPI0035DF7CDC
MSDALTEELHRLAHILHVPPDRVEHLAQLGYEHVFALRQRVTITLADRYAHDYRRLRLYRRFIPLRLSLPLAAKILPPRLIGRAASSVVDARDMERALQVLARLDPAVVADAAPYMDPRTIARFAHLAPPALVNGLMLELLARKDFSTADLFVDFVDPAVLDAEKS